MRDDAPSVPKAHRAAVGPTAAPWALLIAVDTGDSMLTRNQGIALAVRITNSRKRDTRLRVITHGMVIL